MRCSVVLDREPSVGIVQVGACQEETEIIAKENLLGCGQPEPGGVVVASPSRSRRLDRPVRVRASGAVPSVTGVGSGPITKPAAADQTSMQRRIQQRDGVRQRKTARKVCNRSNRGHDANITPDRRLGRGNAAPADDHPNEPRSAARTGHRGLDRAAWCDVETVKSGGGGSGEDRRVRQTELCGDQPRHRLLDDLMPGIEATTKSAL